MQVSALVNQELYHFKAICIDSVIDWPLILGVGMVEGGPEVDELLRCTNVTFSNRIVNRCLPILVLPVDDVSLLTAQKLDDFGVTFTSCIEQRRLFQRIFLHWVNAHLDQHSDHPEG